ncbi:hypothetical protein [Pelagicoccus sp. SDUM812005]|uniref:hypothetical protein n=1 Tax=Pelagicoccus sp. SDUM812005 TaxID=3041257 RepID=UPI00280DB900|nr:hypothetical protein [Pelagicoccus sp. SDUM812005]MDQ8183857.1 hypothetical protein [Pelagicoccus sp. SDUM812005]
MENLLIAVLLFVGIFSIPLFIIPFFVKRQIRKDFAKRGWRVIRIKHVISDSLALSIGSPAKTRYDVLYENEKGEIMNPDVYTEELKKGFVIEQNYPIARDKKYR